MDKTDSLLERIAANLEGKGGAPTSGKAAAPAKVVGERPPHAQAEEACWIEKAEDGRIFVVTKMEINPASQKPSSSEKSIILGSVGGLFHPGDEINAGNYRVNCSCTRPIK
jgi:hypothetical protein